MSRNSNLDTRLSEPDDTGDQSFYESGAHNRSVLKLSAGEASFLAKVIEYTGDKKSVNDIDVWHAAVLSTRTALDGDIPIVMGNDVAFTKDTYLTKNTFHQDNRYVLESARIHAQDLNAVPQVENLTTQEMEDVPYADRNFLVKIEGNEEKRILLAEQTGTSGTGASRIQMDIVDDFAATSLQSESATGEDNELRLTKGSVTIKANVDDALKTTFTSSGTGIKLQYTDQNALEVKESATQISGQKLNVVASAIAMHEITRAGNTTKICDSGTNDAILDTLNVVPLPATTSTSPIVTNTRDAVEGDAEYDADNITQTQIPTSKSISVQSLIRYLERVLGTEERSELDTRWRLLTHDFMNHDVENPESEIEFQAALENSEYFSLQQLKKAIAIVNKKITTVVGVSPEHLNSIGELAAAVSSNSNEFSLARELSQVQKQISNLYSIIQSQFPSQYTENDSIDLDAFFNYLEHKVSLLTGPNMPINEEPNLINLSTYMYSSQATDALQSLVGGTLRGQTFDIVTNTATLVPFYPVRYFYLGGGGIETTRKDSDNFLPQVTFPSGVKLNQYVTCYINVFSKDSMGFFKDINMASGEYVLCDRINLLKKNSRPEMRLYKEIFNESAEHENNVKSNILSTFKEDKRNHSFGPNIVTAHNLGYNSGPFSLDQYLQDITTDGDLLFDADGAPLYEQGRDNPAYHTFPTGYEFLVDKKVTKISTCQIAGTHMTWNSTPGLTPEPTATDSAWSYNYWPVLATRNEQSECDVTVGDLNLKFMPTTVIQIPNKHDGNDISNPKDWFESQVTDIEVPTVYATDEYIEIIVAQSILVLGQQEIPALTIMRVGSRAMVAADGDTPEVPAVDSGFTSLVERIAILLEGDFIDDNVTVLNEALKDLIQTGTVTYYEKLVYHSFDLASFITQYDENVVGGYAYDNDPLKVGFELTISDNIYSTIPFLVPKHLGGPDASSGVIIKAETMSTYSYTTNDLPQLLPDGFGTLSLMDGTGIEHPFVHTGNPADYATQMEAAMSEYANLIYRGEYAIQMGDGPVPYVEKP